MSDERMAGPLPELDALGVRYHMEYGAARARFVKAVCIPWSPSQWVGVLHREGQWLSTCCGTISAIRDRLMTILADGGWVSVEDLSGIISLMKAHDGFMDWFMSGFTPDPDTLTNPLYLLVQVWNVVKDRQWASWVDVPARKTPERLFKSSAHSLENALRMYGYFEMFHSSGDHPDKEAQRRANFQHQRDVTLALSRVVPALVEFTESLKWKACLPLGGIAIVRRDDRDVVLDTRGGPAIYADENEANEVIAFWCTNDQNHPEPAPKTEDFEIRPVTVSMNTGIEFEAPKA
jgi:hypothetical protein